MKISLRNDTSSKYLSFNDQIDPEIRLVLSNRQVSVPIMMDRYPYKHCKKICMVCGLRLTKWCTGNNRDNNQCNGVPSLFADSEHPLELSRVVRLEHGRFVSCCIAGQTIVDRLVNGSGNHLHPASPIAHLTSTEAHRTYLILVPVCSLFPFSPFPYPWTSKSTKYLIISQSNHSSHANHIANQQTPLTRTLDPSVGKANLSINSEQSQYVYIR